MLLSVVLEGMVVLSNLRASLRDAGLDAYIIHHSGQHHDEVIAPCDDRIAAVSGFIGSEGSAIITLENALLWMDTTFHHEANQTLGPGWTLIRDGEPETPSKSQWLNSNMGIRKIGMDPKTYPNSLWDKLKGELDAELIPTMTNLVNDAWTDRPSCPNNPIHDLPLKFSGKSVTAKLSDIRKVMTNEGASVLVVSELDEVAWLLNLRGSDLPQASVFFSYVIVRMDGFDVFVTESNIPSTHRKELVTLGATFYPYDDIGRVVAEIQNLPNVTKIWISKYANAFVANSVTASGKQMIKLSPIMLMKSIKNPTEVDGMRSAHLKDSSAIIAYLSWLEIRLNTSEASPVTEISGAQKLLEIRRHGEYFVEESFSTISAFGSNGAIIHYTPTHQTDKIITKNGVYLLDSGGLYWDGTTDITRTVHFGTPTAEQKDRFTRVLKGHIAIASATFPNKLTGNRLDSFARKSLWDIGEDYGHGTGHGIGFYLNVHEGPQAISIIKSADDNGLQENMFISIEPGFYKDDEYGIRIENIVRIANSTHKGFLEIESITFVPIQAKMIDVNLLTSEEIKWVNDYHKQCRQKIIAHMKENPTNSFFGTEAQDYLIRETSPIIHSVPSVS